MATELDSATRRVTAYVDNLDSRNTIHSPEAAARFGYRDALVTGVVAYGWAVPAVIDVLGERWLSDGWTEFRFRRPIHEADEVAATVSRRDDGACDLTVTNQQGERCVVASVGLGTAPWFEDVEEPPERRRPEPAPDPLLPLTLADFPLGQDLAPRGVTVTAENAAEIAGRVRDDDPRWRGASPLIHPHWIGSQMYQLLLHSYDVYPSMHVHSRLQHLAPARAGQTLALAGRFVESYERNGNHYAVIAGGIFADDGTELVRVRYSTVFKLAER